MKFFTEENSELAQEIIGRYPKPRSAMIPLLHLAQEQEGWVTDEAMTEIAELVGTTSAEVLGDVLSNLGQDTVFGDVRIRYGEVFDELIELFWGYSVLMSIVDL